MKHEDVFKAVYAFVDNAIPPAMQLVADNEVFSAASTTSYMRLVFLPAGNTLLNGCSGDTAYKWVFRANLYVRQAEGLVNALAIADNIISGLPARQQLTTAGGKLYLAKTPELKQPLNDGKGWLLVPISLLFATY